MNDFDKTDRLLSTWFELEAPARAPDDLRTDIHHATARLRPRPTWLALLRGNPMDVIVGGARRREPRLVPLLLLIGLLLTIVAAGAFIGSQPRNEAITVVPSGTPTSDPTAVLPSAAPTPFADSVTELPYYVVEVIRGDDAMWLTTGGEDTRELARQIYRVDPATGEATLVVAEIGADPASHASIVETQGSLWVVVNEGGEKMLRFDSSSGELLGEIPLGAFPIEPIVGLGYVWSENYREGSLTQIDPATGQVVATIDIEQFAGEGPRDLAVGSSLLWAVSPGVDVVVGVDPATHAVARELPLQAGGLHCGVEVAGSAVWAAGCDADDPLQVFDDETGEALGTITDIPSVGLPVHIDGDVAWLPVFDQAATRLVAIDLATLEPAPRAEISLGAPVGLLASGFNSLWYAAGPNLYRLSLDGLPSN